MLRCTPVVGEPLPEVSRLDVRRAPVSSDGASMDATWVLRGVSSNSRYTTATEAAVLRALSPELGRREDTRAALIPIRMSAQWWDLAKTNDVR